MSTKTEKTGAESFSINFTDNMIPVYEEGDYAIMATDYSVDECGTNSKNPGAKMVVFKMVMAESGVSGEEPYEKGDPLCQHRLVMIEACEGMATSFMIATGNADPDTPKGTKMNFVPRDCLNKPFMAHLLQETYTANDNTDKLKNVIQYVNPISS